MVFLDNGKEHSLSGQRCASDAAMAVKSWIAQVRLEAGTTYGLRTCACDHSGEGRQCAAYDASRIPLGGIMQVVVGEISETQVNASISGEVDADNCSEMGSSLLGSSASAANLVLDASGLAFIDSSGISELLRVRELMVEAGGSLVLVEPAPNVRRVLEITGLSATFGL